MTAISTNWSQYENVKNILNIREKTEAEKNESYLGEPHLNSEFVKDCLYQAQSFIRIDKRVIDVCKNPSVINGGKLFLSGLVMASVLTVLKVYGVAFALLQLANWGCFFGFISTVGRHCQNVLERIDVEYFPVETRWKNIQIGLCAAPIIVSILAIVKYVGVMLLDFYGFSTGANQRIVEIMTQNTLLTALLFFYGAFIAPIAEEFLNRGIITDAIELKLENQKSAKIYQKTAFPSLFEQVKSYFRGTGETTTPKVRTITDIKKEGTASRTILKAALYSAIIFAALHLESSLGAMNLVVIPVIALMGLMLNYLKEYTGDLWAPTVVHMYNNVISLLAAKGLL